MARLVTSESIPLPVVVELRALGHDVLTALESGMANRAAPDDKVLSFAVGQQRILLTLNRKHFVRLHRGKPSHSGIIVCTVDPDGIALAQRVDAALRSQPDMFGQLVRVNRSG